jgi:crotonobetainyl-CoA:carnitine CoA-transferase CaiB-like acyl-CoA transferase
MPLSNLRLIDLSRQLPGPFCSTMLADLGMDVLVVANPTDPFGAGIPFLGRNKRSMTLNLKAAEGREILLRLVDGADVLLEGFRPGVAGRLGIDYETLRERNPRLIYCAISGYGQDGPYRDKVGHDVNYLGYAGVLNYIGETGRAPIIPGIQIADIGAGALMAAVGILSAVIARGTSGHGQMVDIAMLDGALAWNAYPILMRQLAGQAPERGTMQLTGHYPCYAVYETSDGRYVTVGAFETHFWATLCRHFGREDFIPRQWDEGESRAEMFRFLRDAFRSKTLAQWMSELGDEDICFGPVATIDETFADPQLRHRGMIVDDPLYGGPAPASPIHLSDTPPTLRTPPPTFGQHTDEVLRELGYDDGSIARLRRAGIA